MASFDDKNSLEQKRIDLELKLEKDKVYVILLMTFGICLLLIGSTAALLEILTSNSALWGIDGIGFFLLVAGSYWHYHDEKSLKKVEDKLNEIKSKEEQGYRFGSEN